MNHHLPNYISSPRTAHKGGSPDIHCRQPAALGLVTAAILLAAGCGRQDTDSSTPSDPASASGGGKAGHSEVQTELDTFRHVRMERDAAKRPLVLSEPAANRRDWAVRALEQGYAQGGGTNQLWDAQVRAAFKAFADYTRAGATSDRFAALTNAIQAAAAAGCRDPMLHYLRVRSDDTLSREQFAIANLRAFKDMLGSRYHPAFKALAGLRAFQAVRVPGIKSNPDYLAECVTVALEDLARDTNAPPEDVFQIALQWLDHTRAKGWTDHLLRTLAPILGRNWGRQEAYFRFQGLAEVKRAWDERGNSFANAVKEEGWEGFGKHLKLAQAALERSWEMCPSNAYTAYLMMQVELGQGQGRDRMQLWFDRAMAFAPNYYDAVKLMSFYLEPRWYGSEDQALEFARSCVVSTNWGGSVPLILPEVHRSLATYQNLKEAPAYWHRPEVWEDVRSGYDKFFASNPGDADSRHDYARYAYLCGHFDQFLAQVKLFPSTNFEFFGGETRFRQMLKRASTSRPSDAGS